MLTPVPAIVLSLAAAVSLAQPLPTDPRLITGTLDNGLTYIIRPHNVPEGRVELQIHFATGSMNETDSQRGLAHYLEHMAFNGSENFQPGTLVPLFQSMGLQFGRDQNAYTSMTETVYQLSMPESSPDLLRKGLLFFSDITGRLSLLPDEIENERQIIQEERRSRLSGPQRTSFYVMDRIAPGSLYGKRITIGTEETINSVNEQDFREFWTRYYTPSNATLMIVGDTDPEQVIPMIQETFGDLPKKPRPQRQDLLVRPAKEPYAIVASDPEITSATVSIMRVDVPRTAPRTVPEYRAELVERLAQSCFNARMTDLVSRGGRSFMRLTASMRDEPYTIRQCGVSATAEPSRWKEALREAATELQRARRHGFTQRELDNARTRLLSSAEQAVRREATTPSRAIIGRITAGVGSEGVIMSARQEYDLLSELLPSITVGEVSSHFATEMEPRNAAFVAVLPSTAEIPSEPELLEMGLKALDVEPESYEEPQAASTLMEKLPEPGAVAESALHEPSGVWSAWLENGVRIHHKFMDERKDSVTVSISLIGGELLETAENRGITSAAAVALGRPATRKLSSTDIRNLLTGKKILVSGGGGGRGGRGGGGARLTDGLRLFISGSPEDLETGMQVAHLLLTEPLIEDAAFTQWKTQQLQGIEASEKNPARFAQRLVARTVFPESDVRVQAETAEQIRAIELPAAQAWLDTLIRTSPIEVTIVGDISRAEAEALVTRYLGSLPSRERVGPETYAKLRTIERPKGPRTNEVAIDTQTPQAFVLCGFYGPDARNVADARAFSLAGRILTTRMISEVREKEQLVYSIGVSSSPATTFPGFGMVQSSATTDPHKVEALKAKVHAMYAAFAAEGPTDEELAVAKGQFARTFEQSLKEPSYWSARLEQLDFRGASLDELIADPQAIQALTAEEVKTAFAKYYTPESAITVVVRPRDTSPDKPAENAPAASPPASN
jgi:zinc protease